MDNLITRYKHIILTYNLDELKISCNSKKRPEYATVGVLYDWNSKSVEFPIDKNDQSTMQLIEQIIDLEALKMLGEIDLPAEALTVKTVECFSDYYSTRPILAMTPTGIKNTNPPVKELRAQLLFNSEMPESRFHKISHLGLVLDEVRAERNKQDKKWGVQNHDVLKWHAILSEEVGEAAKAVLECDSLGYRQELVQIAAVAVAMIESFDRNLSIKQSNK